MPSTSLPQHVQFDHFGRMLHEAVTAELEKVMTAEIEKAKERLEKAMRASVGGIAAKVLNNFSYDRVGQDLIIRVQFAFPETKNLSEGQPCPKCGARQLAGGECSNPACMRY